MSSHEVSDGKQLQLLSIHPTLKFFPAANLLLLFLGQSPTGVGLVYRLDRTSSHVLVSIDGFWLVLLSRQNRNRLFPALLHHVLLPRPSRMLLASSEEDFV